MYLDGLGVPKDEEVGAIWVRKSAETGLPEAQRVLGGLYCNGTGVKQDVNEGLKWIQKAVDQNSETAKKDLEIIRETIKKHNTLIPKK